jgi:hypothetical protein
MRGGRAMAKSDESVKEHPSNDEKDPGGKGKY